MQQIRIDGTTEHENAEYEAFVEKFKPKKTTDDCYTPPIVYDAVADYVTEKYGYPRENFVRPFYPGGDYYKFDYPDGCVVVDNPPFSILSQIVAEYQRRGIKFFLFAPALTCLSCGRLACSICVGVDITYENGAKVITSFITNLDNARLKSAPDLYQRVQAANDENLQRLKSPPLPKYVYPPEVVTAARVQYMSQKGVQFSAMPEECKFIRTLDSQKTCNKGVFGAGFLLGARATQAAAAAQKWQLSERELEICAQLQ